MKVITFSQTFPKGHPKEGQPTYFVEKIWDSVGFLEKPYCFNLSNCLINFMRRDGDFIWPKHHTIRSGKRWKKGDWFSPRVWGTDVNPKSGRSGAYQSKQIEFLPAIQIKNVWDFEIKDNGNEILLEDEHVYSKEFPSIIARNDGLNYDDFLDWFKYPKPFIGQIICWNDQIQY